jgi:hypothetical protein
VDTPNPRGGKINLVGLFGCKKMVGRSLVGKVELRMGAGNNSLRRVALREQLPNNGRAHHALVTCNVDFQCGDSLLIWSIKPGSTLDTRQQTSGFHA